MGDDIDPDVVQYLNERLHDFDDVDAVIKGIVKALRSAYGKHVTISHLQNFGNDGIRELAKSVQREEMKNKHKNNQQQLPKIQLHFNIPHHKTQFVVDWKLGESILDVAQKNSDLLGEYMEGTCNGTMSCCTCHIYLDGPTAEKVPSPQEGELDMLDLAYDPIFENNISRLGCQVILTPELIALSKNHTITITIPGGVNNVWHVNTWF